MCIRNMRQCQLTHSFRDTINIKQLWALSYFDSRVGLARPILIATPMLCNHFCISTANTCTASVQKAQLLLSDVYMSRPHPVMLTEGLNLPAQCEPVEDQQVSYSRPGLSRCSLVEADGLEALRNAQTLTTSIDKYSSDPGLYRNIKQCQLLSCIEKGWEHTNVICFTV